MPEAHDLRALAGRGMAALTPHPHRGDLIAAAAGTGIEPEYLGDGTPDGEIDRQFVDSTKLREMTGWRPEVELRDGLIRSLDWYRDHPELRPEAAGLSG